MRETSDRPESSTRRLFIEQAVPLVFVDHVLFHVGFFDALGRLLGASIGEEKAVHFSTQSDEFNDGDAVQFVFEKTDDFCIFLAVEWVLDADNQKYRSIGRFSEACQHTNLVW